MNDNKIMDPVQYIRIIYALKKDIEDWAETNLQDLWPGKFQLSYMQVLIHIDREGTTNKLLAKQAQITKQAMSRIISSMVEKNIIEVQTMESDKRYSKINLTEIGKNIVDESHLRFSRYIDTISDGVDQKSIANSLNILALLLDK
ncbi:MarR family winged helix-turn-helix transcriptional regulator [Sphingobacterium faecale]|uniref:Winged helix-turn-helix transcriptional regulator n=1 Tax=Sphingobacterium faecale TaxID=2803775 RepID=A0ABS1R742_9SPHI|nr:MarR family winged helix-turn-helix transcriptional regulator [Sphingobacterium faecale]MBL1410049.1 winged helix-turn-helix transcriptional regulator [Sphingobacterium faecale]